MRYALSSRQTLDHRIDLSMKIFYRQLVAQQAVDISPSIQLGIDLAYRCLGRTALSEIKARAYPLRSCFYGANNTKRCHTCSKAFRNFTKPSTLFFRSKRPDSNNKSRFSKSMRDGIAHCQVRMQYRALTKVSRGSS